MYPALIDRKPLHRVLWSLSAALDLNHNVVDTGTGLTDHILFGPREGINDLSKVLKRAGFVHAISTLSDRCALTVKNVWLPAKEFGHE